MYLEFFYVIADYFKTLDKRKAIFEWLIPLLISIIILVFIKDDSQQKLLESLCSNAVSLLGVLIGFSIASVTLLATSTSDNMVRIRSIQTKYKIGKKPLTLFSLLHVNFTYAIVIEVAAVVFALIVSYVAGGGVQDGSSKLLFGTIMFLILHVLFLNMRNITDFYFILMAEADKKNNSVR
ncbi:hypothetical protein D770_04730 [Flammeovirgaceae bacterium 311]|nr:hypothetical protein D770_04730 [Flammeovirgaceae bacterium 311]